MIRLLAIAELTLRAAWRQRAVAVVGLLLALILGVLPNLLADDSTLVGRLRILITYLFGLSQGLLCLFSAWLAAEGIARDIAEQPITMVITKPVARWQLWLGRWLGLMVLNTGCLLLVGLGLNWQVQRAFADDRWDQAARDEAAREVLTSRADHWPVIAEPAAAPEPDHPEHDHDHAPPAGDWQTVAPGETKIWRYHDVRAGERPLTLRFQFLSGGPLPEAGARGSWSLGEEVITGDWPADRPHRLTFTATGGGELSVSFHNDSTQSLAFPLGDGPVLLRPTGGLAGNLGRALALAWLQLGLLTAMGLACGALLSFPVAAFVLVGYLLVALQVPLVAGQLAQGYLLAGHHGPAAPAWLETLARGFVRFGLELTSGIHRYWPLPRLSDGLELSDHLLRQALLRLGLLQTGLVALVGNVLFARRELSAGGRS